MGYQPIEDYGIIGNMHTTALVGMNGSIDWFCYPRHDSPSVFAGILDEKKGGHFSISPTLCKDNHKQYYWPETNVLVTRFLADCGVGEVVDFMPVGLSPNQKGYHWLVRKVSCIRSSMTFRMECQPAFNYARDKHETQLTEGGVIFKSEDLNLGLVSDIPLKQDDNGVFAEFSLSEGESAVFILREVDCEQGCGLPLNPEETTQIFQHTIDYWRGWISKCTYKGRWREMVERSALILKLLTYEPTGAIIAAPTCGLPEGIGGERNWDYRYSWIRDSAFTLYALMRIGFTEEAGNFIDWIISLCPSHLEADSQLQIVYGIDGRKDLEEKVLDHLEGYKGSSPVRIGNGAYDQTQLDIYGELMDAVYLFNKHGTPISYDTWCNLRKYVEWVCENWHLKDSGIWETRDGKQDFVYSKLMCWVAVDRGLRLAEKRSFPANREKWLKVRDEIYVDIMKNGWSEDLQTFIQYYGSTTLDASNLIMPLVFFTSPNDPRMLKTLDAIMRSPQEGGLLSNSLVYRYNTQDYSDGLEGEEGSFNLCTFWLVEALTRAGRGRDSEKLNKARLIFEEMLSYANHLGLYAEETGNSGEALGNFPQAFTHLALISAAYNLDRSI